MACAGMVFTTLYHHVTDIDNLRDSYHSLDGRKATGIDGVTKEAYGVNLEENLRELSGKLKRMGYRPKPKRRTYVPKPGSDKKRPLGISCLEDKIVEEMVKRVLEPIYETEFEDCSYGYRPGRGPLDCVQALGATVQQRNVSHVVEADIRGFFDHVNHQWLLKFLSKRIGDNRILRLIHRMLKSGILEDGLVQASEEGTPQGSIISPLLSNVYLHYTLDQWFSRKVTEGCQGEAYFFRYADDFVACFQYKSEAETFRRRLGERLDCVLRPSTTGRRKDKLHPIWTFCKSRCRCKRKKTRRIHIPGIHLLLWENPERMVQSKTPNQPQEDGPKPEEVYGMGEGIPDKTAKRRDAAPCKRPDTRASQSLCHNR